MEEIRIYGDPVLRKNSVPVENFDEKLHILLEEMKIAMYGHDGVGLAAPQVGHTIRVALVDITGGEQEPYVLINPEIIYTSDETEEYDEGCLSIPEISIIISRPSIISVRSFDRNGKEYTLDNVSGLMARTIQHEIDHLNGILFVDRATVVRRQLVSGKLKRLVKSQNNSC